MARLFPYAGLFISTAILLLLYLSDDASPSKNMTWTSIDLEELDSLRISNLKEIIDVEREAATGLFWVTTRSTNSPDAVSRYFRPNSKFVEFVERLRPLRVQRVLGFVDKKYHVEYGLEERSTKVSLSLRDRKEEFILGKRSYGSNNIYIFDALKKKVLLVNSKPFESLKRIKTLMFERAPFIVPSKMDKLSVTISGESVLTASAEIGNSKWKVESPDGDRGRQLERWLSDFRKLKVKSYLPPDEVVNGFGKPLFSVELNGSDSSYLEKVQIWKRKVNKNSNDKAWVDQYILRSLHIKAYGVIESNASKTLYKELVSLLSP